MLLVYGAADAAHAVDRVAEYGAWARAPVNQVLAAERLGDVVFRAGPAAAGEPSGFFLLSARDDHAAIAIAQSHPHVRDGGAAVLRRIR
jgi:hypothetical protein